MGMANYRDSAVIAVFNGVIAEGRLLWNLK
jgi:hypothetical protein